MKSYKPLKVTSLEELLERIVITARQLAGRLETLTNEMVAKPEVVLKFSQAENEASKKANKKIIGLALTVAIFEERCELAKKELCEKHKGVNER